MNAGQRDKVLWGARFSLTPERLARANRSLHLDKFMDQENPEWNLVAKFLLDDPVYRLAYQRWERRWAQASAGRLVMKGRVSGRLAAGLGAKGVLEVGLRLSHSYGTPIIAGSAIKGVLRARVDDPDLRDFLFGSQSSAGFVEFQDAWWIPETRSPLAVDVMTVHHPKYYSREAAPTDYDNPNPVQFLSARGSFLFVAEFLGEDPGERWKRYVEALLKDTLEKDGVGGKRSTGYGRFLFAG